MNQEIRTDLNEVERLLAQFNAVFAGRRRLGFLMIDEQMLAQQSLVRMEVDLTDGS